MARYSKYGLIWSVLRIAVIVVTVVLVGPFVALGLAPMLLVLLPVALLALPFMLFAFFSGAAEARMETRRMRAWHMFAARLDPIVT
jgi:hypothetical protein